MKARNFALIALILAAPLWAQADLSEDRTELLEGKERFTWQRPDRVVQLLSLREGETVVDLGAGSGFFARILSSSVGLTGIVHALEFNPKLVEHMKSPQARDPYGNILPALVEGGELPLGAGEADLVLSVNHWHRFQDRASIGSEVSRVLKPGGRLVIVDWHQSAPDWTIPQANRLDRKQLIDEMQAAGWELTSESHMLRYQFVMIFRKPTQG